MRRIIFSLLDLFLEDSKPSQFSGAIVLGMLAGFSLPTTLQFYFWLIALFALRVHLPLGLFSMFLFWHASHLFEPFSHSIGHALLADTAFLRPIWSRMYHAPIIPFTAFNHTIVLGNWILSMVFSFPLFIAGIFLFRRHGPLLWNRLRHSSLGFTLREAEFYQDYVRKKQNAG